MKHFFLSGTQEVHFDIFLSKHCDLYCLTLKEAKREILRDMHVKELIQSNHSER